MMQTDLDVFMDWFEKTTVDLLAGDVGVECLTQRLNSYLSWLLLFLFFSFVFGFVFLGIVINFRNKVLLAFIDVLFQGGI